jgi:hypothetical protein
MIGKRTLHAGLIGAVLAGGSLIAVPGIASASVKTPHSFAADQQQLEQQLANRVSQLARLSADVTGATALKAAHVVTLNTNISTASSNINALVIKMPTDTTEAQLAVDRAAMLRQNRVFAVLTPQVFQTIEADAFSAQVVTQQANEASLQSSVNSILGQHGYTNAFNHYVSFVKAVNNASVDSNDVATEVLAQTPADYPGDTHVFVRANRELLAAGIALAHASYDASVIGLATGGYTGA